MHFNLCGQGRDGRLAARLQPLHFPQAPFDLAHVPERLTAGRSHHDALHLFTKTLDRIQWGAG
jgi:hypothetical protein